MAAQWWFGVGTVGQLMIVFTIVSMIISGLFWFVGVPMLALKFGKPISRHKFFRNMVIYSLFILAGNVLTTIAQFRLITENADYLAQESLNRFLYIGMAKNVVWTLVFFLISYTILKFTKSVDVKLPAEFKHIKPVKATVMEVDSNTAVEYNEKRYVLSKPFKFMLRDTVKVRIIEGNENCYLA